jgi:preprotein translocase subunit SecF
MNTKQKSILFVTIMIVIFVLVILLIKISEENKSLTSENNIEFKKQANMETCLNNETCMDINKRMECLGFKKQ